jgi:hypothetical protein
MDQLEYARLKDFLSFYAQRYLGIERLPPEQRPIAMLEAMENTSPKKAVSGLRQAINDCVEMSLRLPHQEVEELDARLRALGIVTLSELRRRYSNAYARIVKRGRIRDETEYYLVHNISNDPTEKTTEERRQLEELLRTHEAALQRKPR